MKRSVLLILTALTVLSITACKGGENKGTAGNTEGTGASSENPSVETDSAPAENNVLPETGASEEAVGSAPEKIVIDYPFEDRFIYGNKNLFYIEDDGSLSCEFRGTDEQTIEYGTGGPDRYFFIVNENGSQTLYFFDRSMQLSNTPISYPAEMYVESIEYYNGKLYYYGYDRNLEQYATYFYDPEGDAFDSDNGINTLERHITNYKGRELSKLINNQSIVRQMVKSGNIYMKDGSSNEIYVFDDSGNETLVIKDDGRDGDYSFYGTDWLLKKISNYGEGERRKTGGQEYVLYNVRNGKETSFTLGDNPDYVGVSDIKNNFVYYYETKLDKGVESAREYSQVSVDDLTKGSSEGSPVVTIPVYPNVDASYGNYSEGNNGYDAFTVKNDRIYYLVFDEKGEDGKKGDVVWRSLPSSDPSDETVQKTGAMERHETFSDYGYVTASVDEKVAENSDGFVYFKGSYQSFRFNNDIENADKLNNELEKIDEEFHGHGDDTAESAYKEIVEEGEEGNNIEWFRDYIGYGYTYDVSFGGVQKAGKNHLQVRYDDYSYYGGAHGMGSSNSILFDLKSGNRQTIRDLYKGTEQEFNDIALQYSMDDWKNDGGAYYESYDGTPESEASMRESFLQCISIDMNMEFKEDGINLLYAPYAVGPYASGEIPVFIPYWALGIEDM